METADELETSYKPYMWVSHLPETMITLNWQTKRMYMNPTDK